MCNIWDVFPESRNIHPSINHWAHRVTYRKALRLTLETLFCPFADNLNNFCYFTDVKINYKLMFLTTLVSVLLGIQKRWKMTRENWWNISPDLKLRLLVSMATASWRQGRSGNQKWTFSPAGKCKSHRWLRYHAWPNPVTTKSPKKTTNSHKLFRERGDSTVERGNDTTVTYHRMTQTPAPTFHVLKEE